MADEVAAPGVKNVFSGTSEVVVQAGSIGGDVHVNAVGGTAMPVVTPVGQAGEMFVGRAEHVEALLRLLSPTGPEPGPVVVGAVQGMGGIGKTALARHVAGLAVGWFAGGAVWADMRGYEPDPARTPDPELVYAPLLRALGVPGEQIPATPAEQATEYHLHLRQLAAEQRWALIVLDNVSSSTGLDGVLPADGDGSGHRVLITSRDTLDLPAGSTRLAVGVFTSDEAHQLWRAVLAPDDPRLADDDVVATVLAACGWLPLAVGIAAGIAAAEPELNLADLAEELCDQASGLVTLTDDRGGVPGVIRTSFARLRARDPDSARLLALLALHPGPDFDLDAAAVLADQSATLTRAQLRVLKRAHLLETTGSRWRFHDLVVTYLRTHACADLGIPTPDQDAATDRLLEHCMTLANAADDHLRALPGQPVPAQFSGREQALAWLDAERAVLAATVTLAFDTGRWATTTRLTLCLGEYLLWRRLFPDLVRLGQMAVSAAERLDSETRAGAWNNLGLALRRVRRFEEAIAAHTRSGDLWRVTGDRHGEGSAWNNLGLALQEVQRFEEAIAAHTRSGDLWRATGDRHHEGTAWNNLGLALQELQRLEEAIAAHTRAGDLFRETGDRRREGMAYNNLGLALRDVGRLEEAIEAHSVDLEICQETNDCHGEGAAWNNLGLALWEAGRFREARSAGVQSVAAFMESGDEEAAEEMRGWLNELDDDG